MRGLDIQKTVVRIRSRAKSLVCNRQMFFQKDLLLLGNKDVVICLKLRFFIVKKMLLLAIVKTPTIKSNTNDDIPTGVFKGNNSWVHTELMNLQELSIELLSEAYILDSRLYAHQDAKLVSVWQQEFSKFAHSLTFYSD